MDNSIKVSYVRSCHTYDVYHVTTVSFCDYVRYYRTENMTEDKVREEFTN